MDGEAGAWTIALTTLREHHIAIVVCAGDILAVDKFIVD